MKISKIRLFAFVVIAAAISSGCDNEFYLSEKEVAAYNKAFATQADMNRHFDTLQGRSITLVFDNSTGTPKLQSTNLLTEMRLTELAQLESGQAPVSLDRLRGELETQISKWVEGKLRLYSDGSTGDGVRLTQLDSVTVEFLADPTFTFMPERQSIAYDLRIRLAINGTIEVTAVNWLIDIFAGINGTYPMQVNIPDLQLSGEAGIYSPLANAGRIRFGMVPVFNAPAQVLETGMSVPSAVKDGVRDVVTVNLSARIDENFEQEYYHFAMPQMELTAQSPTHLKVHYRMKADWLGPDSAKPQLHIVTRSADGKLYHARKSNGGWSSYAPVPFPSPSPTPYPRIENEPVLVHSGQNQLELAAVNQAGEIVYAHYRDEQWEANKIIKPDNRYNPPIFYRGTSAMAASAPGQAEVIAVGSDGHLWHHRRVNGAWYLPVRVPVTPHVTLTAPFRDPAAVHVGNKIVITFADSAGRLGVTGFDLETGQWGQSSYFMTSSGAPTSIIYAPAMVATGERRANSTVAQSQIDVAYVKTGGAVYHHTLNVNALNITAAGGTPGISFVSNEKVLPGVTANASPVITCSTYLQSELFVRGTDSKIRHNHFLYALGQYTVDGVNLTPGWQGWSLVTDNFVADSQKTDGRVGLFSAAGTNTGRTLIAAHGYDVTKQFYMHNEYESGRYGRALTPWKAVHWRGWEAAGALAPVGRPALAAVDQNFRIGHISTRPGFGSTMHREQLGETNATYFIGSTTAAHTTNPVAPIVLTSAPGVYDTIFIRSDGKPQHESSWSNGSGTTTTLFSPAGISLTATSAVGYGNGFIDLAARGSDNRIYFWRYRGGAWTAPVAIATNVISAPILIHKGSGQLELFGIDLDYHLYRWRFLNNAWQPRLSIAHSFRINPSLFGSSSASSWGDGTVDLAVVGLDTRSLYYRRVGPGDEICTAPFGCPTPRSFTTLGGSIMDDPVMTAFSRTRLNILVQQGLSWYSISANKFTPIFVPVPPPPDPQIAWTVFQSIGGSEMLVGGAANTGRNNFAALAVKEGQFFINRNISGNWTGFQPIIGQQPNQILRLPIIAPSIAAHGD
ncbi:MAG: hypothetical protein ABL984_07180 [Pyrinomonadaceae bacterium]